MNRTLTLLVLLTACSAGVTTTPTPDNTPSATTNPETTNPVTPPPQTAPPVTSPPTTTPPPVTPPVAPNPPVTQPPTPPPAPSPITPPPSIPPTPPAPTLPSSSLGGCTLFPKNNIWNTPVTKLPVHKNSSAYVSSIGTARGLHADFGSGLYQGQPIGIPFVVVPSSQPGVKVTFGYDDESDHAAYPIPKNPPIEGGSSADGDRHILMVRSGECKLYEVGNAYPNPDGSWTVGAGAIWNLNSNALRPRDWTSADAAGLPILPGLIRHDEVASGVIRHALRFTAQRTQKAFVWPARHQASNIVDVNVPPMGARFRLKASFVTSSYPRDARVILEALKTYGMILADNGSNWFLSGTQDDAWNNDVLSSLSKVKGSDFEAVDTSSLRVGADSGEAVQ